MSACIFCQIIAKQLPAHIVYEDDQCIVFNDIHPKARIHLLVAPKIHIVSLYEASSEHAALISQMLLLLPQLAKAQGLQGFRTVINTGKASGQEVPHLHFHLLGA